MQCAQRQPQGSGGKAPWAVVEDAQCQRCPPGLVPSKDKTECVAAAACACDKRGRWRVETHGPESDFCYLRSGIYGACALHDGTTINADPAQQKSGKDENGVAWWQLPVSVRVTRGSASQYSAPPRLASRSRIAAHRMDRALTHALLLPTNGVPL